MVGAVFSDTLCHLFRQLSMVGAVFFDTLSIVDAVFSDTLSMVGAMFSVTFPIQFLLIPDVLRVTCYVLRVTSCVLRVTSTIFEFYVL